VDKWAKKALHMDFLGRRSFVALPQEAGELVGERANPYLIKN
jgi:hypothetical protein